MTKISNTFTVALMGLLNMLIVTVHSSSIILAVHFLYFPAHSSHSSLSISIFSLFSFNFPEFQSSHSISVHGNSIHSSISVDSQLHFNFNFLIFVFQFPHFIATQNLMAAAKRVDDSMSSPSR
ncbi:hypothetical protein Droror1_Dr00020354 [Drosera rotundifolia]